MFFTLLIFVYHFIILVLFVNPFTKCDIPNLIKCSGFEGFGKSVFVNDRIYGIIKVTFFLKKPKLAQEIKIRCRMKKMK